MTIILFLHILFGLWFASRTYLLSSQSFFSSFAIKSSVIAYLVLMIFLSQAGPFWFILGIHLPIFIFIMIEYLWVRKKRGVLRKQFLNLLDSVMARMRLGSSFRDSLKLGIDSMADSSEKKDFQELKDCMVFSQTLEDPASPDLLFIFQTFKRVDQDSQPITHLRWIQHTLKVEEQFQKRAEQALLSIHAQSTVLIILYIGLLIFILSFFGTSFLPLIFLSLFLFSIGTAGVFIIGRKIKWSL